MPSTECRVPKPGTRYSELDIQNLQDCHCNTDGQICECWNVPCASSKCLKYWVPSTEYRVLGTQYFKHLRVLNVEFWISSSGPRHSELGTQDNETGDSILWARKVIWDIWDLISGAYVNVDMWYWELITWCMDFGSQPSELSDYGYSPLPVFNLFKMVVYIWISAIFASMPSRWSSINVTRRSLIHLSVTSDGVGVASTCSGSIILSSLTLA